MRKQFEETVEDLMAQNEHFVLLLGDIGIFGFRNAFRWAQRIYNPGLYRCSCVIPPPCSTQRSTLYMLS